MSYSEEEIKKYLNILSNYKNQNKKFELKSKCRGCSNNESFSIYLGLKICDECGTENGHVLGLFDLKDLDRVYYRKKSIYYRKYHYEKKVNNISKVINLNDEEKCKLYDRIIKIDNYVMKILNKPYFRKRMININYICKKILEEMGCEKFKLINLKISSQTLEIYDQWWKSYKEIK